MTTTMRQDTLETLGLGTVLGIFRRGQMPASTAALVEEVFGPSTNRRTLVITGGKGIVGAGKAVQLSRLLGPHDVRVVTLDLPGAPDGLGQKYGGLVRALGREGAARVMSNISTMTYDGRVIPSGLNPGLVIEAIPEVLDLKRTHYKAWRAGYPDVRILSVTSGFPAVELGVGIAHPAFPHETNRVWEMISADPKLAQLFWALGMVPMPMADHWSFCLDVLFCGLTLAALRYHEATNTPVWKTDKLVRALLGPNPLRAHDTIGPGATFLTHSCLAHLASRYSGGLFTPTNGLKDRLRTSQPWYPQQRPMVNWTLSPADEQAFRTWIMGPLIQMVCLMVHEKRAHPSFMNGIGEICAQFRRGMLAVMRELGGDGCVELVNGYHELSPAARESCWHPEVLDTMGEVGWQQLYVNAEADGEVGVITLGRETLNWEVIRELNRAINWLKERGVKRIILTSDLHQARQLVGADTSEFFGAMSDVVKGEELSGEWSKVARRLYEEFEVSVGVVLGKRCLGGMLELFRHCHFLLATDDAQLGLPEVTLPVVPGMEGCHWFFRRAAENDWSRILAMLLDGRSRKANETVSWLVDYAGSVDDVLRTAWSIVTAGEYDLTLQGVAQEPLEGVPCDVSGLPEAGSGRVTAARKAIVACVVAACGVSCNLALSVQARHSAEFLAGEDCNGGVVGEAKKKQSGA